MKKLMMNMALEVDVRDVIYALSLLSSEQAIEVIKEIEQSFADWGMTEEIAKHYIEEMTHLYSDPRYSSEQPQDKQAWIDYLQSQIDALKG